MKLEKIHEDKRGEIHLVTGLLPEDRELTVFTTMYGYARGGCVHKESDEDAVVIAGSIKYFVEGRAPATLSRGDTIHIPPDTPHYFIALTPETIMIEWGPRPWEKKEKHPLWRSYVDIINAGSDEVKLHLGCGTKFIPGFIHVDLISHPHIDHNVDICKLSMFEDGAVDLIYCSHALQYFDRNEAAQVLEEWHRVLKPGGTLRLAVTDFEAVVKIYRRYGDLEHRGILGPLYGKWPVDGDRIYMKTTYDFDSLRRLLETADFKDVRRYDWRETIHEKHDDYSQAYIPHMDKENGILMSLNVEATK